MTRPLSSTKMKTDVSGDINSKKSDDLDTFLVKHSDLWFLDGSVILRTENTLFRVHMSQLARHSIFFRDLFSLPQPHTASEASCESINHSAETSKKSKSSPLLDVNTSDTTMLGCPVILLHDSPEDVGNLLTAMYDGPSFGNNDQNDFRIVSGILRLSTKYLMDNLRSKALAHLSVAWPTSLKQWDAREDAARAYELETGLQNSQLYPSPIAVINLARTTDAPELLPSAFYDLSRYDYSQILGSSEDGPSHDPSSPSPKLAPSSLPLCAVDMQRLILGKEASYHAITALIRSMGSPSSPLFPSYSHMPHPSTASQPALSSYPSPLPRRSCTSAAACRKDVSELVALATQHYLFDRERGCTDPLYVAEELGQLKSAELSECKSCARALEGWAAKERERIWKMIPIWFQLVGGHA